MAAFSATYTAVNCGTQAQAGHAVFSATYTAVNVFQMASCLLLAFSATYTAVNAAKQLSHSCGVFSATYTAVNCIHQGKNSGMAREPALFCPCNPFLRPPGHKIKRVRQRQAPWSQPHSSDPSTAAGGNAELVCRQGPGTHPDRAVTPGISTDHGLHRHERWSRP